MARPEDAIEMAAAMPAMAASHTPAGNDAAAEWEAMADEEAQDAPVVDSPSISADWPAEGGDRSSQGDDGDWPSAADLDAGDHEEIRLTSHRQRLARLFRLPTLPRIPFMPVVGLPANTPARPAVAPAYLPVNDTPPPRTDTPLTPEQRAQLARELTAARDRQEGVKAKASKASNPRAD